MIFWLWVSYLSISGYSSCFPNPFSLWCQGWRWWWAVHLLEMGVFEICGSLCPPKELCTSPYSLPCLRQRPLCSGGPQPVHWYLPHSNTSENLILYIFWFSSTPQHFWFVDCLSYFPILLCIYLFVKSRFFPPLWFLEIWMRRRQVHILSFSILN